MSKVAIGAHTKIFILHKCTRKTFGLKIENLKLYRAIEKASIDIYEDYSKVMRTYFNILQ